MNNTLIKSLVGGALLTSTAFAGEVAPQPIKDSGISTDLKVGYDSQYIFRGANRGDDLLSTSLEAAWTCNYTGLEMNAGAWYGSFDAPAFDIFNIDELDLYAGASKDLGVVSVHAGFIHRELLDFAGAYAQEVYFGLSKSFDCGLSTSLTYFWDVNGGDTFFLTDGDNNGYTELTLDKSFDVASKQLDLGVQVGYLAEEGDFSHITAKLSHDVALSDNATLTPYIAHSWELEGLESGFTTSSSIAEENELFAGASLTVSF